MKDDWAMPILLTVIIIICVITLYPVIKGTPLTKSEGIIAAFMVVVYTIGFVIGYIKEKSDHDYEISELKRRIETLELRKDEKENGKK